VAIFSFKTTKLFWFQTGIEVNFAQHQLTNPPLVYEAKLDAVAMSVNPANLATFA